MNLGRKKNRLLSDVLSYIAITDDLLLSDDPMRVTAVLEVYFSDFNELAIMNMLHDRLMALMCDFPKDVTISFYYCKNFFSNVGKAKMVNGSRLEIVNYMERDKYEYVTAAESPVYTVYMAITLPVVVEKSGFSRLSKLGLGGADGKSDFTDEDVKGYRLVQEKMIAVIRMLESSMMRTVIRLNRGQILSFLSVLINHKFLNSATEILDIVQSDWNFYVPGWLNKNNKTAGYVYYNGNYHTVLSLRGVTPESRLPIETHSGMNMIFQHKDLCKIPFIVHHSVNIMDKSKGLSLAKRRSNMVATREGFAKKLKFLEKTPEGMPPEKLRVIIDEAIKHVEETSAKFMAQFFHVHLWANSLSKLEEAYNTFDSVVRMTYRLKREKFNIKGAYFSLFPGNEKLEKIDTVLPSFNVSDFMPIELPAWPYHDLKNKWELYYYNEVDSFSKIDLFDVRCSNYNAIVAGASGSGKSFTEQDKLWQAMKYDPCVVIIDFGGDGMGSYLSFVHNVGGTYLQVSMDRPYSINPFQGEYFQWEDGREDTSGIIETINGQKRVKEGGEPNPVKQSALLATLERMLKGKERDKISVPPVVRAYLIDSLRDYYIEEDNNINNTCGLADFANRFCRGNDKFTGDWDLYARLRLFIGSGENRGTYSKFFQKTDKIENDDIICFDMAGLNEHEDLKAVMIPALVNMIMFNILNNPAKRSRRKLVVMDEAWRELQGGDMAQFMQEMFRTVRKLNGQITIITQSIDDLLGSSSSSALMANTSYFWFIGNVHNADSLRQIKAQGRGLTEYQIDTILQQENKKEMYLLTPYFSGKLRFYPTAVFKMLATTSSDDRTVLDSVRKELGVEYTTPEVIERLKNHERFVTEHHAKKVL
jgi:hypothetical protein